MTLLVHLHRSWQDHGSIVAVGRGARLLDGRQYLFETETLPRWDEIPVPLDRSYGRFLTNPHSSFRGENGPCLGWPWTGGRALSLSTVVGSCCGNSDSTRRLGLRRSKKSTRLRRFLFGTSGSGSLAVLTTLYRLSLRSRGLSNRRFHSPSLSFQSSTYNLTLPRVQVSYIAHNNTFEY